MQVKFSKGKTLDTAFGLEKDIDDKIFDLHKEAMEDDDVETRSEAIQYVINKLNPQTLEQLVGISFYLAAADMARVEAMRDVEKLMEEHPLAKLLDLLKGKSGKVCVCGKCDEDDEQEEKKTDEKTAEKKKKVKNVLKAIIESLD